MVLGHVLTWGKGKEPQVCDVPVPASSLVWPSCLVQSLAFEGV